MRKLFVIGCMLVSVSAWASGRNLDAGVMYGVAGDPPVTYLDTAASDTLTVSASVDKYIEITNWDDTLGFGSSPGLTSTDLPSTDNALLAWKANVDMGVTLNSGTDLIPVDTRYRSVAPGLNLKLTVVPLNCKDIVGETLKPVPFTYSTYGNFGNAGASIAISGQITRHGLNDPAGSYDQQTPASITLSEVVGGTR